jgi:hypothetical protein
MFFGDDENVSGSLRVDVFEGENVVVLVNFFSGNFAAEDAAKEAAGGSVGHDGISLYRMASGVKGGDCQFVDRAGTRAPAPRELPPQGI